MTTFRCIEVCRLNSVHFYARKDMNGTGLISWTEFLAATIEVIGTIGEEEFDECFDRLDCDSSGYISTQVSSR